MIHHGQGSANHRSRRVKRPCDHPLAVVIDPSARELSELERMLAQCPHCSRWAPGDGPIMAVVSSQASSIDDGAKELT